MLSQLAQTSSRYGLKLHFGKTKVMTWDVLAAGRTSIQVGGKEVNIMKEKEAEKSREEARIQ